jgi:energy-coupling factor transporter ATP-binding protein EcfA2
VLQVGKLKAMSPDFGPSVSLESKPQLPWQSLSTLEFLVLVGVTGVGKTTTLEALRSVGLSLSLLPDRRLVTDVVMIDALAGHPVSDREERFAWTAKYRELHPGGMAEAIGKLAVNLESLRPPLVFDGLRGLEEVSYAANHYAKARFIVLDAPDTVRVQRLLGRSDAFDRMAIKHSNASTLEQLASIPGVELVFSQIEIEQLANLDLPASEIVAKCKIVVTERRNYDPIAAREYLRMLPGERVLYVDTTAFPPLEVANRIGAWL